MLPWDQLSYWAITIVTGMLGYVPFVGEWLQGTARGGAEIGSATLVSFYSIHTTLMPVAIATLMGLHFWRIRKARGVVIPRSPGEPAETNPDYVLTLPHLLLRELSVALVLVAFVMVVSLFFNAPLGEPANPGMSTNPAKAPWYFVGFQELQLHFHPLIAVVFLPMLAVVALLAIPYLRYPEPKTGPWFLSATGRLTGLTAGAAALVLTPFLIVVDEMFLQPGGGLPSIWWRGLVPLLIGSVGVVGLRVFLVRRFGVSKSEVVQAVFIFFFVALAVLTAVGVWFRGPGMALA